MTFVPDAVTRLQDLGATFQQLAGLSSSVQMPAPGQAAALGSFTDFASLLGQVEQQLAPTQAGSAANAAAPAPTPTLAAYASTAPALMSTGSTSGVTTPGASSFGSQVASDAGRYIGVPYAWGGASPSTGFDCSGLVQHVFSDLGVSLPRTAAEQSQVGTAVTGLQQAQPGDLLFYGSPAEHVGIYIGNGLMINAPQTGQDVSVARAGQPTSIRRVSPTVAAGASAPASLSNAFAAATQAYGLPPGLLQAVAQTESGFNPAATSPAGALGLMQIMPSTAAGLGINPLDPVQSIYGAADLLAQKIKAFGSVPLALAAYNAGDQAVRNYGGIPPYPETVNYVNTVMSRMGVSQ